MTLCIDDITILRHNTRIIHNVSCQAINGQYIYIEGANGAGKSTLLRAIAGLLPLSQGNICYENGIKQPELAAYIWYVPTYLDMRLELTLYQHIYMMARLNAIGITDDVIRDISDSIGLLPYQHTPLHALSSGQKRKAQLAILLLEHRPIWVLDEVWLELDKKGQDWLSQRAMRHKEQDGIIIFTQHHAPILPYDVKIEL